MYSVEQQYRQKEMNKLIVVPLTHLTTHYHQKYIFSYAEDQQLHYIFPEATFSRVHGGLENETWTP